TSPVAHKTRTDRAPSCPHTAACADHLTDPSGHRAVTQCCTSELDFPPTVNSNFSVSCSIPLRHGTPQVTPRLAAGHWLPNQCSLVSVCGFALRGNVANEAFPYNGALDNKCVDCFRNARLESLFVLFSDLHMLVV